jgi:hypothetical protein
MELFLGDVHNIMKASQQIILNTFERVLQKQDNPSSLDTCPNESSKLYCLINKVGEGRCIILLKKN